MTRGRSLTHILLTLPLLLVVGLILAPAVLPASERVADARAAGSAIEWSPLIEHERLVLTVSGGGAVFRDEFPAGENPSFQLVDRDGKALPDGSYTWELLVIPGGAERERGPGGDQGLEPARAAARTQTGFFLVRDGALVDAAAAEGAGAVPGGSAGPEAGAGPIEERGGDFVINQDLVVLGSACIGLDCVNGESFGFDTLRLKENNVRIRFFDTSSTASFPPNDWQITANDSSNGGANKFSIDDIDGSRTPFTIRAGAPSNSMFVDSSGRVGFKTSTPVVELHVKDGNTPTLRLEQDGSQGFTPQTWDVAGNEANFFIRDVTDGSDLVFRLQPGAPANSIFVASDGDVGIGTSNPGPKLHVKNGSLKIGDSDEVATRTIRFSNSIVDWLFQNNGTTGTFGIRNATAGATPFSIETGAPGNLMTLASTGVLISGIVVHPPDYVFDPDYELETIEEHAAYMWENKHLPAVGKGRTTEDGRAMFNLTQQSYGMLEELEKAHIYIEQLNNEIAELEARTAEIDELKAQLARLEALLAAQAQ